ncbi:sigma-70 family RNA polymerase sigma factor [Lentisphaera profundi]|uniref:Sigma-70 family RNA polymerase sigma factor n=1 Tax=Lentisphaera profundi TaxID=1658616 RepID=A0ABY7VZ57_9BACT|nr:sigma-70 family RNA polymerase sigma factor [Lentisphaera profundi]WDE99407.1 sigma-70 family RNA polymerase sigma factor [Lentisphaera profundi]
MDSNKTRVTLLQKLQNNKDESCWDDFVHYYKGYIYVVIRDFGVSVEDSHDMLQDILVRVWKAFPNYNYDKDKCRFRTWLCKVIKNQVYTFYQKNLVVMIASMSATIIC